MAQSGSIASHASCGTIDVGRLVSSELSEQTDQYMTDERALALNQQQK